MNTPVLFLLGAVSLSLLGGLIVWLLSRPRRERFGSSIDNFNRDLSALAPPAERPRGAAPRASGRARPGPTRTPARSPRPTTTPTRSLPRNR